MYNLLSQFFLILCNFQQKLTKELKVIIRNVLEKRSEDRFLQNIKRMSEIRDLSEKLYYAGLRTTSKCVMPGICVGLIYQNQLIYFTALLQNKVGPNKKTRFSLPSIFFQMPQLHLTKLNIEYVIQRSLKYILDIRLYHGI